MTQATVYQKVRPMQVWDPVVESAFDPTRETRIPDQQIRPSPGLPMRLVYAAILSAFEDAYVTFLSTRVRMAEPRPDAVRESKGALCSLFPELLDLTHEEVDRAIRESRRGA